MSDKKYNGWTNYETWNVKLWMDNEESSYGHYVSMAQDCYDEAEADGVLTREEEAANSLAARIRDEYETAKNEWLDESGKSSSVWSDLLGAALGEVNWDEIAEGMIGDVDKEEEEESDEDEEDGE